MLKDKDYKFAVVDGFDPDDEIPVPEEFEIYITTDVDEAIWDVNGVEIYAGPDDIDVHIPEVKNVMDSLGIIENAGMACIFVGQRNGKTNEDVITVLNTAGWTNEQDVATLWRPDLC